MRHVTVVFVGHDSSRNGHTVLSCMQGFGLSLKLGATKSDFDDLVGIHPTDAESFCALSVTKRSGASFTASGGCGGGTCG